MLWLYVAWRVLRRVRLLLVLVALLAAMLALHSTRELRGYELDHGPARMTILRLQRGLESHLLPPVESFHIRGGQSSGNP